MPVLYRIDTTGKEIWNTCKDSSLAFGGAFTYSFVDTNYIYSFGQKFTSRFTDPIFFVAKFDKANGQLIYLKNSIPVNTGGIVHVKDIGNTLRIVYYTFDGAQSNPNKTPINVVNLQKSNGSFSTAQLFGLSNLAPIYIDEEDNVYYYDASDTLIKYNLPTGSIHWKNKTLLQGAFYARPATSAIKDKALFFLFGDRYARGINDVTGQTIWNIQVPSNSLQEFYPYSISILADTIYTGWGHGSSGSITEYGHFSKINKLNGTTYINGTITDTGGINYSAAGYFSRPLLTVDSTGNIYLQGYNRTGKKAIKKISGVDGRLLYEISIVPDVIPNVQNKMIPLEIYSDYRKLYLFNGKPHFLYNHPIGTGLEPVPHITYLQFGNVQPSISRKINYDNNYYQYGSTVIDIQKDVLYTYILKKQGLGNYVEKYSLNMNLVWRQEVSDDCMMAPQGFAIDSTGNICVIGQKEGSPDCKPISIDNTLTSYNLINKVIIFNKNGQRIANFDTEYLSLGGPVNLLGADTGFYLFTDSRYYVINASGYLPVHNYSGANFYNAIFHNGSNKQFHLVNTRDSVYVFSGRLSTTSHSFFMSFNKRTHASVIVPLTIFANGYILHALKSNKNPTQVYISGVTGNGAPATLVKYAIPTRQVIWAYKSNKVGDVFKTVEDASGNVYAFFTVPDSILIMKFDGATGNIIWRYGQRETVYKQGIDFDVNTKTGVVVAAHLKRESGSTTAYYPSYFEISTLNGKFLREKDIKGDPYGNFLQAVESTPGMATLIGGNIQSEALGGRNGILILDSNRDTTSMLPDCNIPLNFSIFRNSNDAATISCTNPTAMDPGTTFTWYFGNGDSSVQINPAYTYNAAGIYTVRLTAVRNNCTSIRDTIIIIEAGDLCNTIPSFSLQKDSLLHNKISFTSQPVAGGFKYLWNFGDGFTDTISNPVHKYGQGGLYTVCLKMIRGANCVREFCDTVQVASPARTIYAYPNPAQNTVTLILVSETASTYTIKVLDAWGNIAVQMQYAVLPGTNRITIPITQLPRGVYVITVGNNQQTLQTKFIKL